MTAPSTASFFIHDAPAASRWIRLAQDRRVQIGAAAAIVSALLLGVAATALVSGARAQEIAPDLADHARLAIVTEVRPPAPPPPFAGKLETLSAEQMTTPAREPLDPQVAALVAQERQEDLKAAAEQRAFDARLRAELQNDPAPAPVATASAPTPDDAPSTTPGADARANDATAT